MAVMFFDCPWKFDKNAVNTAFQRLSEQEQEDEDRRYQEYLDDLETARYEERMAERYDDEQMAAEMHREWVESITYKVDWREGF